MKHDEFIGQVQHRARLSSRGDAERATKATLQTLGERLSGGEAKDVASQLPPLLADYTLSGLAGMGERFTVKEFFQRVSEREGVKFPQAAFHTQAVLGVLQEAVTRGEINDIRSQLPAEYHYLFEASNQAAKQHPA
ncbi:MAG: DUF2267 domain-containing protein [Ktedonobacteraceae bacterium]